MLNLLYVLSAVPILLAPLLASASTVTAAVDGAQRTCGVESSNLDKLCSSNKVQARLPPTINPNPKTFLSWITPPGGWFYGNWKITHTSQPAYMTFRNMQFDSSPVFPQTIAGQNNDLTSFQLPNSSVINTAFGIDTPRRANDPSLGPEFDLVFDFVGSGNLATTQNSWELLAWGYDSCGDGYMVIYETPVINSTDFPAGLDIESRADTGPTPKTLTAIFSALKALGNSDLSALVDETVALVQDGARRGMPPVVCDATCVNNG